MKRKCPFCYGEIIETDGYDGDPFDFNKKTVSVCSQCGRIFPENEQSADNGSISERLDPAKLAVKKLQRLSEKASASLIITAVSQGVGKTVTSKCVVPFTIGTHSLGSDYPFGRVEKDFRLENIVIDSDELKIAGETVEISALPCVITKHLTAYGYDKQPVEELLTVTIDKD